MFHTVLIAGAAGWLGSQIVDALSHTDADVRILLRGGAAHPRAAELARKGEIVIGDLTDPGSLDAAMHGVHTIVSAVQGGPDVIIDGQVALARAGLAQGAARILPSDFSVAIEGLTPARHLFLGWRAEADRQIAALGLPQINVLNGAFTEMLRQPFFGLLDLDAGEVAHWGDPDQPYDFTTTADVAATVAAIAADPASTPGPFHLSGETLSPRDLATRAAQATGQRVTVRSLGSLDDLDAEIARRQALSPADASLWAGLQYHRLMATGEGRLSAPQPSRIGRPLMGIAAWLEATQPAGTPAIA
jgi:nucleoside-diphosphate-sugar epimerase